MYSLNRMRYIASTRDTFKGIQIPQCCQLLIVICRLLKVNGIIFVLVLRAMMTSHKMMAVGDKEKIK